MEDKDGAVDKSDFEPKGAGNLSFKGAWAKATGGPFPAKVSGEQGGVPSPVQGNGVQFICWREKVKADTTIIRLRTVRRRPAPSNAAGLCGRNDTYLFADT